MPVWKILDNEARIFYYLLALTRAQNLSGGDFGHEFHHGWDPFRNLSSLQEQVNRLFESGMQSRNDNSAWTTWAPAVDIHETENR